MQFSMQRVAKNGIWTFFSSQHAEKLSNAHGAQFDELYESLESLNMGIKTVSAQTLWQYILDSQVRTGGPSMLYKDAVNSQSTNKQ
jgi:ribonucleotide reductase alpha subunit